MKIDVQLVGKSNRLSLGVKRYVHDLEFSLKKADVRLVESRPMNGVVHAVSPVFFPRGNPFVVTVGDIAPLSQWNSEAVDYRSPRVRAYREYFRQITARSFDHSDAIIALSSQTALEIGEVLPQHASKVRLVNPGISKKFAPTTQQPRSNIRIGHYRGVTFGLGEVVDLLGLRKTPFSLSSLTGTDEGAIVDYYNSLDYFVDFAPYRGFGYPIVEARACGVTVLTKRRARIPREVKELTLQVEDEEEAAEVIASGTRQERRPVPFTLEKMAAETATVYEELLRIHS